MHPFSITEYVNVTKPVTVGVKIPAVVTPVPDHVPPAGENPVSVLPPDPVQMVISGPASDVGIGFTVIEFASVAVHEFASVTVAV